MKFSEIPYTRPDLDATAAKLDALAKDALAAKDAAAMLAVFDTYQAAISEYQTYENISYIRHTVDTTDPFYDGENDYYDEKGPVLQDKILSFYRGVLASAQKEALRDKYGDILLQKMELAVTGSDERLIALQQEDNALTSQYEKIYAGAKIPFDGQERNVPQLTPYKQHLDRDVRKAAIEAEGTFFDQHQEALDDIFDKLVKNRAEQAKLMGYAHFTTLGDIRMERIGYDRRDIAACRDAVVAHIVPVVAQLKKEQAARLGVGTLHYMDDTLLYRDGNPAPKGTPEAILAAGQEMYRGLSPETGEFIDFMMERDLFDVLAKPGKAPGGYCTMIPEGKMPFIFSNFNGTAGDVDVLTHEAGHAFAFFRALRKDLPEELISPGLESCEIHSMSMEVLTADFHHLFFKEDTKKYSHYQVADQLAFLPYGCQVDEFQERVYTQPELTPAQRNALWLELEHKYRPWNDFTGLPFYGRGAGWQRQMHIYRRPFYYIDYVFAQAVALQFFLANLADHKDAWQRYMTLLEKAGTATYPELVHAAGMKTPYEPGALKTMAEQLVSWLAQQGY